VQVIFYLHFSAFFDFLFFKLSPAFFCFFSTFHLHYFFSSFHLHFFVSFRLF